MGYIFLAPLMLFYISFVIYPSLRTVWMMFMRYDFLRPGPDGVCGAGKPTGVGA